MPRTISRVAVCAFAMAIAAAGAVSAEVRVKIRNDSVHPANITVDKKSRDVRPRKAASFPMAGNTATLTVSFANGDLNKGEFDISETLPVENAEDGNTYYCMTLDTEDFDLLPQAACSEWINKDKK